MAILIAFAHSCSQQCRQCDSYIHVGHDKVYFGTVRYPTARRAGSYADWNEGLGDAGVLNRICDSAPPCTGDIRHGELR